MMTQFFGNFETLETLLSEFTISQDTLDGYKIVIAAYDIDGYEGSAFVLLEETASGSLFEVNGSHCSCYGLEDQWAPEPIDKESLLHRTTKGTILNADVSQAVAAFAQRTGHQIFQDRLDALSSG